LWCAPRASLTHGGRFFVLSPQALFSGGLLSRCSQWLLRTIRWPWPVTPPLPLGARTSARNNVSFFFRGTVPFSPLWFPPSESPPTPPAFPTGYTLLHLSIFARCHLNRLVLPCAFRRRCLSFFQHLLLCMAGLPGTFSGSL